MCVCVCVCVYPQKTLDKQIGIITFVSAISVETMVRLKHIVRA